MRPAGLAGGLLAGFNSLATPSQFSFDVSLAIFAMVIFGGTGNLVGSILGATTVILTKPFLEWAVSLSPETAALWRLTFYGLLLVVLMRIRAQGLLPEGVSLFRPATWRAPSVQPELAEAVPSTVAVTAQEWENRLDVAETAADEKRRESKWSEAPVVLEVSHLSKRFGSITAANDLSMVLRKGTITRSWARTVPVRPRCSICSPVSSRRTRAR
ncbi:MAG: hypothetical protein R2705_06145 [Ilumatobacteraceae bacterium]